MGFYWPFNALNIKQRPTPSLPRLSCAASSGFLNLLTLCSARCPSSLVSCWWRPWAFTYRGLLLDSSDFHFPAVIVPRVVLRPTSEEFCRCDFEDLRIHRVRHSGRGFTHDPRARASLGVVSFEVLPSSVLGLANHRGPPFLGFGRTPSRRNALSLYLLFKVSENQRG
jgi:hypothetical protein